MPLRFRPFLQSPFQQEVAARENKNGSTASGSDRNSRSHSAARGSGVLIEKWRKSRNSGVSVRSPRKKIPTRQEDFPNRSASREFTALTKWIQASGPLPKDAASSAYSQNLDFQPMLWVSFQLSTVTCEVAGPNESVTYAPILFGRRIA